MSDDNDFFARFFTDRADLADELYSRDFRVDAFVVATTALDALAEVWMHDFPKDRDELAKESGTVRPSIRMARLVRRFASEAAHVGKVAVVLFAEDWKKNVPEAGSDPDALLARRVPKQYGQLPYAHLDCTMQELAIECPALADDPALAAVAEEYEYPALVYRYWRSSHVHYGTNSKRTHGFSVDDEVMYMSLVPGGTSLGISIKVVTAWLCAAAANYTAECTVAGIRPANTIDAGAEGDKKLAARWSQVRKQQPKGT